MAVKGDTKKMIIAALSALCAVLSHLGAMAADAVAATDSDIGKVIGADGVVYASVADAEDAQTTAYAMSAYINNAGSFGLAIAVIGIVIDFLQHKHINSIIMRITMIVLNLHFLRMYYLV